MKTTTNRTFLALLALGMFVLAPSVYADDSVAPTMPREELKSRFEERRDAIIERRGDTQHRREDRREDISDRREDRRENISDRREDRQERVEEQKTEIRERLSGKIQNHIDRFVRMLGIAIERAQKFIDRVDARADELDAEGKNTSAARAFLTTASSELTLAKNSLNAVQEDLNAALAATTPVTGDELRALFEETREAIDAGKKHIRAAFEAVRGAVRELKKLETPSDGDEDEDNS